MAGWFTAGAVFYFSACYLLVIVAQNTLVGYSRMWVLMIFGKYIWLLKTAINRRCTPTNADTKSRRLQAENVIIENLIITQNVCDKFSATP
jgi:hypothetical protein